MIRVSVELTALPKDRIKEVKTKSGDIKKYIELVVDTRREPDQYGNTHVVYVNQTKDERLAKEKKVYCGQAKEFIFNGQGQNGNGAAGSAGEGDGDLPF